MQEAPHPLEKFNGFGAFLMEKYHDDTSDGREGNDGCFQQGERGKVCSFGAEPGTNHKPCQRLDENQEIQAVIE